MSAQPKFPTEGSAGAVGAKDAKLYRFQVPQRLLNP